MQKIVNHVATFYHVDMGDLKRVFKIFHYYLYKFGEKRPLAYKKLPINNMSMIILSRNFFSIYNFMNKES